MSSKAHENPIAPDLLAPRPMSADEVRGLVDRAQKNAVVARDEGRRRSIEMRGHARWDSATRRWVR